MKKADLHCHSIYSEHPSEWFLQRIGAGESYTDPFHLYNKLKSEGMAFVTITDHNRIDGAKLLKEKYPEEVFVSVESTAYFPEDGCKIHILIYDISDEQFHKIQKLRKNIYKLRDYIKEQNLAYSVAHATYAVNNRLTLEHLEKLILLFDNFEVINGGRNRMNNNSWENVINNLNENHIKELIKKHDIKPFGEFPWIKGQTGGSDDHAALFLGKTYTMSNSQTKEEFLENIKTKRTSAFGRHNNYQTLAFSIYKIGVEFSKTKSNKFSKSFFDQVIDNIFERKQITFKNMLKLKFKPDTNDADYIMKKSLAELITILKQEENQSIENRLNAAFDKLSDIADSFLKVLFVSFEKEIANGNIVKIIRNIASSLPGIFLAFPFFTTLSHLYKNRELLENVQKRFDCLPKKEKKKILWFTDVFDDQSGIGQSLRKIYKISQKEELDITFAIPKSSEFEGKKGILNIPEVYSFDFPYNENYLLSVPSPLQAIEMIYQLQPDEIYISTPGTIGLLGLLAGRLLNLKVNGVFHTDFTKYFGDGSEETSNELADSYVNWFYQQMNKMKVPSESYIEYLEERGVNLSNMEVFRRGIDTTQFCYRNYGRVYLEHTYNLSDGFYILYTGRIAQEKSLEVALEAVSQLQNTNPDIYFIVCGTGPMFDFYKKKYSSLNIIFTGRIDREILHMYYSGADVFVFPTQKDVFGMAVLEAQACGLPAIVSNVGGPKEIILNKESGLIMEDNEIATWKNGILYMKNLKLNKPEQYQKYSTTAVEISKEFNWNDILKEEFIN